jgi:ethanolamine-phosphate phospho-lyase
MKNFLKSNYGITAVNIKEPDGDVNYTNLKYHVKDVSGDNYILKIYTDSQELELAREESDILNSISEELSFDVPISIASNNGLFFHPAEKGEARLLRYIEGEFIGDIDQPDSLIYDFGRCIGELDKALMNVNSNLVKSRRQFWDLQFSYQNYSLTEYISDPSLRNHVKYYFNRFHLNVLPVLHTLRHSTIHGDLNDYNVLASGNSIKGIIDFGDICYSPLINDLAIAATYIMMDKENPFDSIVPLLKGFHKIIPLERDEVLLLPDLITCRLCVSICNSAQKRSNSEDTEYVLISEKPAIELLTKWKEYNPVTISNKMLTALGMDSVNSNINKEAACKKRDSIISKAMSLSYTVPIYMERSLFQYMYDREGNTYLDAYNNIPHVGHSHPHISEAISSQTRKLNTNTRYIYDSLLEYGERLLEYFPERLSKIFMVNSGSAASDLATRLARNFTGHKHMLVLDHGYHGNTSTAIDISPYKFDGRGGKGKPDNVTKLPLPDEYREALGGKEHARIAIEKIQGIISSGTFPAAFINEPISGCGGQVPLAEDYLKSLYPFLQQSDILTISDEVQVGFGRLGQWFWGFEMHGVEPDIVVLGKPMGNGHPIGAVICTAEIADSFSTGMEFFSSFGGNPVSCAAASAVLDVIEDEGLQQNADLVGQYFIDSLKELRNRHKIIGDIRGSGLFIGVEFTNEDNSPGTRVANIVKNKLKDAYILTSTDGPYNNVIKSKPPLCFNKENVDAVVNNIDRILKKL